MQRVAAESAKSDIATRDQLPTLTGLRFWAALIVVLYHLSHQVGEVQPLSALVQFGRTGVTFFFVLSGFVLAWTYLDRPTAFKVFVWRRFARLWPLVAVTGFASLGAYRLIGVDVPPVKALSTFVFAQAWSPAWVSGANPAAWSLSDEAFFYLIFPTLLAIAAVSASRKWLWWLTGAALVVGWLVFAVSGQPGWVLDYFPPARAVQFVIGVLCAVGMRRGMRAPVGYWPAVGLVVVYHVALIPWGAAVEGKFGFGAYSGSQWWAAPVFALLIMAAAEADQRGARTGATGAWSLHLGHWSYAWYLIHEVIIRLWLDLGPRAEGTGVVVLHWLFLLVVTVTAAAGLYHLVEHPAEKHLRANGPGGRKAARTGQAAR